MSTKWQVGQIARYVNLRCSRFLILEVCAPRQADQLQRYCTLSDCGTVGYHSDQDLLTLTEWLEWHRRFQDDIPPREYRQQEQAAVCLFQPPPWWDQAVAIATQPNQTITPIHATT